MTDEIIRMEGKLDTAVASSARTEKAVALIGQKLDNHIATELLLAQQRAATCPHLPVVSKLRADVDAIASKVREAKSVRDTLVEWRDETDKRHVKESVIVAIWNRGGSEVVKILVALAIAKAIQVI